MGVYKEALSCQSANVQKFVQVIVEPMGKPL